MTVAGAIENSYMICCVQRTGSWLLAHSLTDLGYAGRPSDYFDEEESTTHAAQWQVEGFGDYLEAVRRHATTPNGIFGTKMMWNDFGRFRARLRDQHRAEIADAALIEQVLPGVHYVWLRRQDKIRQGISWWRAVVTQQWAVTPDDESKCVDLFVDEIVPLVRYASECEDGWRSWFKDQRVAYLELTYEELVEDRLSTVNRVLVHVGLPPVDGERLPRPRSRQQADELTEHYVTLVREALRDG